jgi:hypothetical protein
MNRRIFGTLIVPLLAVACSSSDDGDKGGSLQAPNLTEVMPMTGGLHVNWENEQTDCEAIEIERMMGSGGDYAVVFSVPGSADNKMDDTATDKAMSYMYRLRCKKGAAYSAYSNEKSGTPK